MTALAFVRTWLPSPPSRVLEIGCGPDGGFVPDLQAGGYDVLGVDPKAPEGVHYVRGPAEDLHAGIFDAVVASASLHHVDDLDVVLDHLAGLLRPSGAVVVLEWAHERFDEPTARWCFDRLPDPDEDTWLGRHRRQWLESGLAWPSYAANWAAAERLHRGDTIVAGLQRRFLTTHLADAAYFHPDLAGTTEDDETAAAASGRIRATGFRYAGTRPST